MKLKDYQKDVLKSLSDYLAKLEATRRGIEDFAEFQRSRGQQAPATDFCQATWDALKGSLPGVEQPGGARVILPYVPRTDGRQRPIPNICIKVPTGGGKTLLAALAVDRINAEYFKRQTGLVLWVVPSEAIYSQTWRTLADREHPYRQMLERASGGRVKLLEKNDQFTKADTESYLCVMLIMLQAGAVREETKEARKMFQDTGRYPTFFPETDAARENAAMLAEHPDLETPALTEEGYRPGELIPRQSLANVLRLTRPLVVIDEGHKAYSNVALNFICRHNPRFILELSATPNARELISNVLVNVSGTALKSEEMIKLPINVINEGGADWKHALASAKEKLDDLAKQARKLKNNKDRYIRPIMVIRVELVGEEQRDKAGSRVHAADVRAYLHDRLGAKDGEVIEKSNERDELTPIDKDPKYNRQGLLSELCKVRYIITKDALREGWDCPFAYILVALSRTTAATTMTQMVGRVLRQPHAKRTGVAALDECYVFTHDQDVQEAVNSVREGLQSEGMGDLVASVRAQAGGSTIGSRRETLKRRNAFKGVQVFMPKVLSKHPRTGDWRDFDYERDLLSRLPWGRFEFTGRDTFALDGREGISRSEVKVDIDSLRKHDLAATAATTPVIDPDLALDLPSLVRMLLDLVPNPWQAARILTQAIEALRARGFSDPEIFVNRLSLLKELKADIKAQIHAAGEAEFKRMITAGELSFRLVATGDETLNWELATTLEFDVAEGEPLLRHRDGSAIKKSYLEPVYQSQVNILEKDLALFLDGTQAVKWWHRIAERQDWHLQGWRPNRVYPDFLVSLHGEQDGKVRFTVLETKGMHLQGNEDTEYKRKLFEFLTEHSENTVSAGELVVGQDKQQIRFEMLFEADWRQKVETALQ